MKPAFFTIALLLSVLLSCQEPAKEDDKRELSGFDTTPETSSKQEKADPPTLDSAEYIDLHEQLVKKILNLHPGKATLDTLVSINGHECAIRFSQGNLFSQNRHHAIAQLEDNDAQPFFYFTKGSNGWQLKQVFYGSSSPYDIPIHFRDYNYDGFKDLGIYWYFKAGRCNCSDPGCLNLYLYDAALDSLIFCQEISEYLNVRFIDAQRSVYLGEHCHGKWAKFKWKEKNLVKMEEYVLEPGDYRYRNDTCTRTYNKYDGEKIIATKTVRTCSLPNEWLKIFED